MAERDFHAAAVWKMGSGTVDRSENRPFKRMLPVRIATWDADRGGDNSTTERLFFFFFSFFFFLFLFCHEEKKTPKQLP